MQANTHYVAIELAWLVGFPLLLVIGASLTLQRGGRRRVWLATIVVSLLLALLALFVPELTLYRTGPRSAAWVQTWTLPVAAFGTGTVTGILGHPKIPSYVRGLGAFVVAALSTAGGIAVA